MLFTYILNEKFVDRNLSILPYDKNLKKINHNKLAIFLDNFSISFQRNSTRKTVRWFEELINFNHLTIFITEFHQKLIEKLSMNIHLFKKF